MSQDPGGDKFIAGQLGFAHYTAIGKFFDPFGVNKALFGKTVYEPDPASVQLANLSYQQWQQAAQLMYPAQNQLIQYATDPGYIARMRGQAQTDVDAGFNAQAGARQRLLGLMGVTPTAAQSAGLNKQTALARAAAEAGAMNQAAGLAAANQQGALQGFA